MITLSHANGIHTARLATAAAYPGRLLASAMESRSEHAWVVTHRAGNGHHLMYVSSEAAALGLLDVVARELAT